MRLIIFNFLIIFIINTHFPNTKMKKTAQFKGITRAFSSLLFSSSFPHHSPRRLYLFLRIIIYVVQYRVHKRQQLYEARLVQFLFLRLSNVFRCSQIFSIIVLFFSESDSGSSREFKNRSYVTCATRLCRSPR